MFTLGVVNAVTSLLAICNLAQKSPGMQQHNIPATGDEGTIQGVLDKDFPAWKDYIERQAKRSLNKLKIKEATQKATQAVLPIVKEPISQVSSNVSHGADGQTWVNNENTKNGVLK